MIKFKYIKQFLVLIVFSLTIFSVIYFTNKFSLLGSWVFKGNTEKFNKVFNLNETSLSNYLQSNFNKGKIFFIFKTKSKCRIEFIEPFKSKNFVLQCEYKYNKSLNPNTISFYNIENIKGSRHGIIKFINKNLFITSVFSTKKKFRSLKMKNKNFYIKLNDNEDKIL